MGGIAVRKFGCERLQDYLGESVARRCRERGFAFRGASRVTFRWGKWHYPSRESGCYSLLFIWSFETLVMADAPNYPKIAQLRDVRGACVARLAELGLALPIDEQVLSAAEGSPLARPIAVGGFEVGNRWCIHAMEGWDANTDGSPSEHTLRRWRNFGLSGAKLIWGGEAAAVRPDGRANPNQTMAIAVESRRARGVARRIAGGPPRSVRLARRTASSACSSRTPAGSASRTITRNSSRGSRIIIRCLAEKYHLDPHDDSLVFTDAELDQLADDYVAAAHLAAEVGFQFVDVKACHGYLLHEFLSARTRPGKYGGDLAGRSRLLALDHRPHSRRAAATDRRRAAERVRLRAVRQRPATGAADGLRASCCRTTSASACRPTIRCRSISRSRSS